MDVQSIIHSVVGALNAKPAKNKSSAIFGSERIKIIPTPGI